MLRFSASDQPLICVSDCHTLWTIRMLRTRRRSATLAASRKNAIFASKIPPGVFLNANIYADNQPVLPYTPCFSVFQVCKTSADTACYRRPLMTWSDKVLHAHDQ
jgi:hypothetical protein